MKKMLKGVVCLVCALAGLAYVLSASTSLAQAKKGKKRQAQIIAQGKTLFISNCARCHGGDGLAKTQLGEMLGAPNLTDAKRQSKMSDSRMRLTISRGREAMPAFIDKLSKGEIAALVAYVRTLKK